MKTKTVGLAFLTLASLCGCSGVSSSSTDFIPDLPVQCSSSQASECSNSNVTVYVGIKDSVSSGCSSYLSGITAGQFEESFTASGSVVATQVGGYLYGVVDSWTNSTGGQVFDLFSGTYTVCAFADVNANGVLDSNEPVGTGQITAGTTGYKITDWQSAP